MRLHPKGGAPYGVLIYNAQNSRQIDDQSTIDNLAVLETDLVEYDLYVGISKISSDVAHNTLPTVVEVQTGESWDDYRPARPQDFVGRDELQKDILNFLESAKSNNGSRVFAITGNSGLGKSSLIAKLRDRSRNKHYKNKYFVFAVDIRGARAPAYILSSLLACIKNAQDNGFGEKCEINITDPSSPLSSPDLKNYLNSLDSKGQVICLAFDQFEELYSKPELFGIFKAAKDLMLDVAGSKRNFVLGFAWKTDSTTQQDHPAYHMWHELGDHRREYRLDVFDSGEISTSITKFEKEIGSKLALETRHQITHSCQGFPWLLKKLCINLFEGMSKGEGYESMLVDLDAARLFEADINSLNSNELACLKLVAQNAPADWSEIIESSGVSVLNNLVHKRLVIKSGDRLNIYWDIFRDYLLTKKIPVIPYNYIPTTDPSSLFRVCKVLLAEKFQSAIDLSKKTGLRERTIWNIGADLVMLGLAERDGTSFKLHKEMPVYTESFALKVLRTKLDKHSLKLELYKRYASKTIEPSLIRDTLISILPREKFGDKTWNIYSNRLTNFLINTGFITRAGRLLVIQDIGAPINDRSTLARRGGNRGVVFSVSVSPYSTVEALEQISNGVTDRSKINRNALQVLMRFELVSSIDKKLVINEESVNKYGGYIEAVWSLAKNENSLTKCAKLIANTPNIDPKILAQEISNEYKLSWSEGSLKRNGGILFQWSKWVIDGINASKIPSPPGRHSTLNQSINLE